MVHLIYVMRWWEHLIHKKQLRLHEKGFFLLLCAFEIIYRIGFFLIRLYKNYFHVPHKASIPVISLGNISVGGTGKSVLTRFIIKNISPQKGAIFLRGYGGENAKTGNSLLLEKKLAVRDGVNIYGDEAQMFSLFLNCPVIVGANRKKSFFLLKDKISELSISYILLDDGYQNSDLIKDFEILLLDARSPFDNKHCLPAGKLREKNISRADLIILTHADLIDEYNQQLVEQSIRNKGYSNKILMGKHLPGDILNINFNACQNFDINEKYLAIAGIGSPNQFLCSLHDKGINIKHAEFFEDHHIYTDIDVMLIKQLQKKYNAYGIITTCKDLVKLTPYFNDCKNLYALDTEFAFLNQDYHREFLSILKEKIVLSS